MFGATVEDDKVVSVRVPERFDVMVFQRITHRYLAQAIPFIREKGIAVVVDMDDDLETIHPSNPAWAMMHPRSTGSKLVSDHSWHFAKYACEQATVVTVSSDALIDRYARRGNGVIVRNCVPQEFLTTPHCDSERIGWGGSIHSHPDDLPVIGTAISQLVSDGAEFMVAGPPNGVKEALRLEKIPMHTGSVEIGDWPAALTQIGVGVAPLADTRFNAAKSWLKPLEYASVGVPCVMSPRTEYARINKLGIGMLASKPSEWRVALQRLLREPDLRTEMSDRARVIASTLTVQGNVERWVSAWQRAYDVQVRRPQPVKSVFGLA
jgi:glycosyltransferase involved in cell wall biosynthesis